MAATAVGTYATLANLKSRLGDQDTLDDTLLQLCCDQSNMWIETRTGRILAPIPAFATTVASGFTAGTSTGTLTTVAGLNVGDVLCFEALGAATRESVLVTGISGSTVTTATNVASTHTGAVKRVYVFDGFNSYENGKVLPIPLGIISLTSLEVATFSAGSGGCNTVNVVWYTIPNSDTFIRPNYQERVPGWPGTELCITNVPLPGDITPSFYPGYNNCRVDAAMGWPATPDDLAEVGLNMAVALYRGRGSTGGEMVSVGTDGTPVINRALTYEDKWTLSRYARKDVRII